VHLLSRRNPETKKSTPKVKSKNVQHPNDIIATLEKSQYAKVIKMMIEHGADINFQNSMGDTPLHQASLSGNEDAIHLLLKLRAKITLRNL
jgi:ankyrin repeat protein